MITTVGPGDVLAVVTGDTIAAELIRLGAQLEGKPAPANHVVIASHQDKRGTWWGVEGRPGGVGWVDLHSYLTGPWARYGNSNASHPRTDAQDVAITTCAAGLLGTGYDWTGIAADTLGVLRLTGLAGQLDKWWGWSDGSKLRPAHVVCSSLAAWVYRNLGLPGPPVTDTELCTPADWWAWNAAEGG